MLKQGTASVLYFGKFPNKVLARYGLGLALLEKQKFGTTGHFFDCQY